MVSDCDSGNGTGMPVVVVVAVVLVSPSSVVTEVCDGFSLDSDWELVEPQSLSPKSARVCRTRIQERWVMKGCQ